MLKNTHVGAVHLRGRSANGWMEGAGGFIGLGAGLIFLGGAWIGFGSGFGGGGVILVGSGMTFGLGALG